MTILFSVSLFVLFALIVSKAVEMKMSRAHFLSRLFLMGDAFINSFVGALVFKYNRYKKIINIFIFEFIPSYVYETLTRMKDYVSKKYYSAGDEFRGKRVLRSNGSVSFFLERLSEDKTR